jgi:hypothetical protein
MFPCNPAVATDHAMLELIKSRDGLWKGGGGGNASVAPRDRRWLLEYSRDLEVELQDARAEIERARAEIAKLREHFDAAGIT